MGIDAETYAAAKGYTDGKIEGGGGTLDYEELRNHPSINGNELTGNKSSKQLGITNLWTGTTSEWAQLTADQKAQYTHVCFTDDNTGEDAIEDVYAVMGEMGAKNLIPYPYDEASGKDNRGVVFTYGADGIMYMNGTSDATNQPFFTLASIALKASKPYVLYCDSDNEYVFTIIYFRNSDNTAKTITYEIEYSDGTKETRTSNYISLNKSGTLYKWAKFTLSDNSARTQIDIRVVAGSHQVNNAYGKVMLIDGRDTDLTWKIFAKTNKQLTDEIANKVDKEAGKGLSENDYSDTEKGKVTANAEAIEAITGVYGAKNIFPLNINDPTLKDSARNPGIWSGNSYTLSGATLTFDVTDGGYIKSIALSGTASNDWVVWLNIDNHYSEYNGFILSGKPVTDKISVGLTLPNSPWTTYVEDTGEDVVISGIPQNTYVGYQFTIHSGNLLDGIVLYPMIRDARIKDPTYVPYAMTNRELTERVQYKTITLTPTSAGADLYEYINHPDSRTPKFIVAQCIAPTENASANLNMWWQTFDVNGQSLLRYVASNANLTYTVALCYFY